MNKYFLLFIISGFLLTGSLCAQMKTGDFNRITLNDERTNLQIQSIIKDSKGYLWFGTDGGLIRFDGYNVKKYRSSYTDTNSISDNRIFDMHEGKDGLLWLATFGGLDKFDRKTGIFSHFYLESKGTKKEMPNFILQVLQDKKNERMWVKRVMGGLYLLQPQTRNFEQIFVNSKSPEDPLNGDVIYSYIDKQDNLWFSLRNNTKGMLGHYNYGTKKFTPYNHNPSDKAGIADKYVRTIFEDSQGNLWFGMENGLDKLNIKTGQFTHYLIPGKQKPGAVAALIVAMEEDDFGMIWLGTILDGLYRLSPTTGNFTHFRNNPEDQRSLRSNRIMSLYNDKAGTLWIGTDRGLNSYTFNYKTFNNFLYSSNPTEASNANYILDIAVDKNNTIWYCTEQGIYKLNKKNKPELVLSIPGDDLEFDNSGKLWIGDINLLMSFDIATGEIVRYYTDPENRANTRSQVWSIYKDGDIMWCGTSTDGVIGLDVRTGEIVSHFLSNASDSNSISKDAVGPILRDKDLLWIGPYTGGLNSINLKTRKVTRYLHDSKDQSTLSHNIVLSIYRDKKERLWVGTIDGLNLLLPDGKSFRRFKEIAGSVFSICEDKSKNIWLATLSGLSKIDPETFVIHDYDSNDGFQINPESHLKQDNNGEMIVFGQNGFTAFRPDEIIDNLLPPAVSISDFQIFGKSVIPGKDSPLKADISETKEISLSYKESFFTFEFAALNYVSPEKNQYAYKLDGFESEWNYVDTRRFAYYTNVPPGTYVFRVKASNNDGVWNEEGKSVKVIINPPFWQTWWFRIFSLLFVIGSVVLYFRVRMNGVKKRSEELELVVKERTESLAKSTEEERKARQGTEQANKDLELKNKELEQFAYVASHDMQEPLRTTSSFVELLQRQYKGKLDGNADKYLHLIAQSSDRMKVLINDLLDYSRIGRKKEWEQVDCNKILQAVTDDLAIAISETGARITIENLPVISAYPTEIKQLFQNLISNAIKFRKKEVAPEIKISVKDAGGFWEFKIKDNGIGIEEKYSEKIFVIFQRLHTRDEYEGSGIGLAHCKKIVELHGGEIRIESKPGEGTVFYFTIRQVKEIMNAA